MCKRAAAETLVVLPAAAAALNNNTFQDLTWRRGSSLDRERERERERVIHLWLLTTPNWVFSWRAVGGFVSCLWDSFHSRSCCDEAEQGVWSYAGFHGCTRTQQWRNRSYFCCCCCGGGFLELLWDDSSSSTRSPRAANWGSSKLQNLLIFPHSIHLPTWPGGCCCCCWVCNWPGSRSRIGRQL